MPYEDSPYFETPCHTKPLWRYMHIDKFLAMLSGESLYFPNVYSYNDKSEGTLSDKSLDEICRISLLDENNTFICDDEAFYRNRKSLREPPSKEPALREQAPDQEKVESGRIFENLLRNFLSHLMYCNSWFQRDKESHSMWAEYGDKIPTSIAIQTTVGHLIESLESYEHSVYKGFGYAEYKIHSTHQSLESDKYNIHIGKVKYKDYAEDYVDGYEGFESKNLTNSDDVLKLFYEPFLHKRDIYKDEHEVRAIISFEDVCEEFLGRVYTSEIPYYSDPIFRTDASLLRNYKNPINNAHNGIPIEVNLQTLLKKIVISPTFNDYFNIPFEDIIRHYNINPNIISMSQIVDIQEES